MRLRTNAANSKRTPTSVTAEVPLVAVDELLLGQADQLPVLDRVLPLHVARGAECPAGAAVT